MSSEPEQDTEINVVSSPESSPIHGLTSHDNNNGDGLVFSKKSNNNMLIDRLQEYEHELKFRDQDQGSVTTANTQKIIHGKTSAAFTSFSISSILSRNEPKKDLLNNLSLASANDAAAAACYAQDSSMLSR
jgi:hypothetical protein